ncbi:MAG: hypothetical protein J6V44_08805 [Methanobrevibacter sp.]|nr:hypothetical protein [Methanobrevibacter sp.]
MMPTYAIQNRKTGKFVDGTDFRRYPYTQITSYDRFLTFDNIEDAKYTMLHRMCGKNYKIVRLVFHPEELTGVWENCYYDNKILLYKCSVCGNLNLFKSKKCRNCNAKMEGDNK